LNWSYCLLKLIYIIKLYQNGKKVKINKSRIIEEVIIKRKKNSLNKEKQSEKVKSELLNKKKKRQEKDSYVSAQKIVKDYREKQKSHSAFKRKVHLKNRTSNFYDANRENSPIVLIRIAGAWERLSKEVKTILLKLRLKKLFSAIILKYDRETFAMVNLIDSYITWG
jgi:ribosomal protein L30/L7E